MFIFFFNLKIRRKKGGNGWVGNGRDRCRSNCGSRAIVLSIVAFLSTQMWHIANKGENNEMLDKEK